MVKNLWTKLNTSQVCDPTLDTDVTYEELLSSTGKFKQNKAAGSDGLPGEYFKTLPDSWLHYLLNLLEQYLYTYDLQER